MLEEVPAFRESMGTRTNTLLVAAVIASGAAFTQPAPAATDPQSQLVAQDKPKHVRGLTEEQIAMMERESVSLQREFRIAEKSYGADHLDLRGA